MSLPSIKSPCADDINKFYSKTSDAIQAQQSQGFEKLQTSLQHFISQCASGNTKMSDLVRIESSVKDHTTLTTRQAERAMKNHLTQELAASMTLITNQVKTTLSDTAEDSSIQASSEAQYRQLLQSLKFPAMNERRNHVKESFEGTFRWVFDLDETRELAMSIGLEATIMNKKWDNFSEWLKSDSDLYWISGKIGSGKSTLMKFIVSSPRTTTALNTWAPGSETIVLSHFFWKPGSQMQKSLRGFLCCILQQALLSNPQPSQYVRTNLNSTSLKFKDTYTDWSFSELKSMTFEVLESDPGSFCIFVDGLDEVSEEDGAIELLQLIDELKVIPNVKLCVASRPEFHFQNHLGNLPHLRLQDLTNDDMKRYTEKMLRPHWKINQGKAQYLTLRLVEQAQGVFLWLHLAVRSLIEGLEHADSEIELQQRLDYLPNDLSKLYSDMWSRMNENKTVYRADAARYFNLILSAERLQECVTFRFDFFSDEKLSIFDLMTASESQIPEMFLNGSSFLDDPELETIVDACQKTQHKVLTRCAGLLEIIPSRTSRSVEDSFSRIHSYYTNQVDFVHRSAYDFLTDTEEGRQVRQCDSYSEGQRWLVLLKGFFIKARCGPIWSDIYDLLGPFDHIVSTYPSVQSEIRPFLMTCWRLYNNDWLTLDASNYAGNKRERPHFLAIATSFPIFKDFIVEKIEQDSHPPSLATSILQDMTRLTPFNDGIYRENLHCFVPLLLHLGADTKGVKSFWGFYLEEILE